MSRMMRAVFNKPLGDPSWDSFWYKDPQCAYRMGVSQITSKIQTRALIVTPVAQHIQRIMFQR